METLFANKILFGEDVLGVLHLSAGRWLDYAMVVVTAGGSELFYTILLPVLYWCWDRKRSLQLGVVFLVSMALNNHLKYFYNHPRPDPAAMAPLLGDLARMNMPPDPGFPSGHAQGAVSFWGPLMILARNRYVSMISVLMLILIPYSRIYLGVHFLGDIAGGYIIGLICLSALLPAVMFAEREYRPGSIIIIMALVLVPVMIYSLAPAESRINTTMGVLSGSLIGAYLGWEKIAFNPRNRLPYQLAKIGIGLPLMLLLRIGLKKIMPANPAAGFLVYWFLGYWYTFVIPYIFALIRPLRGDVEGSGPE